MIPLTDRTPFPQLVAYVEVRASAGVRTMCYGRREAWLTPARLPACLPAWAHVQDYLQRETEDSTRPVYILGESFGGILSLAVAAELG